MTGLSTRSKEAIKTALAIVLVYGIALRSGWLNPYWGAFTVAMISLPTAGQSLRKGLLRIFGTVPGAIAGLMIVALAPQDRWAFLALACAWVYFATYMMLVDKRRPYFWNVMGFVAIIIASSQGSSESLFNHALYRTAETALGLTVYMLVTVFLWPHTNVGAVRKAAGELLGTQAERFTAGIGAMTRAGRGGEQAEAPPGEPAKDAEARLAALHTEEVKRLAAFTAALQAEGLESYDVFRVRRVWTRFGGLAQRLAGALDRWQLGLGDLRAIDIGKALPGLDAFRAEIDSRLAAVQQLVTEGAPAREPSAATLVVDHDAVGELSNLDRAALALAKDRLQRIDALTRALDGCARELAGVAGTAATLPNEEASAKRRARRLPAVDPDALRGAAFTTVAISTGFLLWILFNPPGHMGWVVLLTSGSMALAATPQIRATMLIKPLAILLPLAMAVYVLVLPRLSTFWELGATLFVLLFLNNYLFTGVAQIPGKIAIINIIAIQNQQVYVFAAIANSVLYIFLAILTLAAMSYLLGSSRPEKVVLALVRRFFRSAEYLVQCLEIPPGQATSPVARWRRAFYLHELQAIPHRLAAWGKSIDKKLFPANDAERVTALATRLQALANRIAEALDEAKVEGDHAVLGELSDELEEWRTAIGRALAGWARRPEAELEDEVRRGVERWTRRFEERVSEATQHAAAASETRLEDSFRVLGMCRGITAAAVAYTEAATTIDWSQWREEKFS